MQRRLLRRKLVEVAFPEQLGSDDLEKSLKAVGLKPDVRGRFLFDLTQVQFAPLETLVALLCLVNRFADEGADVALHWSDEQGSFGYAERMGFFELLHEDVDVMPLRPEGGTIYKGTNPLLLEMTALPLDRLKSADSALKKLTNRLQENLSGNAEVEAIVNRIWTCASETVSNIYEHSESPVPGVITVQRYATKEGGSRLQLVIADAGLGLTATIRKGNPMGVRGRSEVQLILAAFQEGISSKLEPGRGCGLTKCAQLAAIFAGNLRVRTGSTWAKLVTKSKKGWTVGIYDDAAVQLPGTQIVFDFYLDRVAKRANLFH
ncbi:MAG TPA: ATP-binding protein [Polyangiaceae bacterium]|nr:ATP-binding protein [Polyangiaceae bacterium]